jgi:HAMP domain-containing protein
MIRDTHKTNKLRINLDGPDGNAFVLIGTAVRLAKQLEYPPEAIQDLRENMKSGDYNHLIKVMDKHFGEFLILETSNKTLLKQLRQTA